MSETFVEQPAVIVIDMQAGRYWGECCMCGRDRRLDHAVPYWCGPSHMQIGQTITLADGTEQRVGGMCVCKECHDRHESERPKP